MFCIFANLRLFLWAPHANVLQFLEEHFDLLHQFFELLTYSNHSNQWEVDM